MKKKTWKQMPPSSIKTHGRQIEVDCKMTVMTHFQFLMKIVHRMAEMKISLPSTYWISKETARWRYISEKSYNETKYKLYFEKHTLLRSFICKVFLHYYDIQIIIIYYKYKGSATH